MAYLSEKRFNKMKAKAAAERQAAKEALEYALSCLETIAPPSGIGERARAILQRLIENPEVLR